MKQRTSDEFNKSLRLKMMQYNDDNNNNHNNKTIIIITIIITCFSAPHRETNYWNTCEHQYPRSNRGQ